MLVLNSNDPRNQRQFNQSPLSKPKTKNTKKSISRTRDSNLRGISNNSNSLTRAPKPKISNLTQQHTRTNSKFRGQASKSFMVQPMNKLSTLRAVSKTKKKNSLKSPDKKKKKNMYITHAQDVVEQQFNEANINIKESLKHFKYTPDHSDLGTIRTYRETAGSLQNSQSPFNESKMVVNQSQEFQDLIQQTKLLDQKIDEVKQTGRNQSINIQVQKPIIKSGEKIQYTSNNSVQSNFDNFSNQNISESINNQSSVLLRDKIRNYQNQIDQFNRHLNNVQQNYQSEIAIAIQEKEQAQLLLKKRNEAELRLQSEILEKNTIIENLTKKLKESTQIILQINQKNQSLSKNYSSKITEKLKQKSEELRAKEKEKIQKLHNAHQNDMQQMDEKIQSLTNQLKEEQNYKEMYHENKLRIQEMESQLHQLTELKQMNSEQSKSMSQIQTYNQSLQNEINQLIQQVAQKDLQISETQNKFEALEIKKNQLVTQQQKEFDELMRQNQEQSESALNQKNNEIQELITRLNDQQLTNQIVQSQYQANTQQEIDVANNLKREAEERADNLSQMVNNLELQILDLNEQAKKNLISKQEIDNNQTELQSLQQINSNLQEQNQELSQDIQILNKELEFSKIEQEQLNSVIQNQSLRIQALEKIDLQKNEQIADLQNIEIELTEQLENIKINLGSQSSSLKSNKDIIQDNRLLLIEENNKMREDIKDLNKQINQLQLEVQALSSEHQEKQLLEDLQDKNSSLLHEIQELQQQIDEAKREHLKQSESQSLLINDGNLKISSIIQEKEDLVKQIQDLQSREQTLKKQLEDQFGQTVDNLENQVQTLSREVSTKTFEFNLKAKEVDKLKKKEVEYKEIQDEMEAMAIQTHTEHLQEVEQLEEEISKLNQQLRDYQEQENGVNQEQNHEENENMKQQLQDNSEQMKQMAQSIETLKKEKYDLTKLIAAMKGNLKQMRKVFMGQIQAGVSAQKKYLNMCRSQDNLDMADSQLFSMTDMKASEMQGSDEETHKTGQSLEVTQEFKNFEAEKELVQNAVNEIATGQIENNQGIKEQYQNLFEKLKEKQNEIDKLTDQMQQLTIQQKDHADLVKQEVSKVENKYKEQIEQITLKLVQERQDAQEQMIRSASQKSLQSDESNKKQPKSKDFETKIKKLEYENKQHQQSIESFQKVLSAESLKRQETEEKVLQKEEDNQELLEDVKQLTETLEAREDEIMNNYQKYQKDLKNKDAEINGLRTDMQELMKQMGDMAGVGNQEYEKLQLELQKFKEQVSSLEYENKKHVSEFEAMQLEKDDIIFDKDDEIRELQKRQNEKDRQIEELNNQIEQLKQNPENKVNELEYFDQQSNSLFVQNRHSLVSTSKKDQLFVQGQSEYQRSQMTSANKQSQAPIGNSPFRSQLTATEEKKEIEELNIYGDEHASESNESEGAGLKEVNEAYQSQNKVINQDINRESADSFGLAKRVKTLNQNRLQQSVQQLELAEELQRASDTSLLNKNVIESKLYQDLEAQTKRLQTDLHELQDINKDLWQQIEKLTQERNNAISDNQSVVSVQEELKSTAAQLATRKEEAKKLKEKIKNADFEIETKEIMIRQLKQEMESYADQQFGYEEKIALLEETVQQLTLQLSAVVADGNQKTIQQRKEELRKIKEEEEKLKPKQMPSFLMPPPEATKSSKKSKESNEKDLSSQSKPQSSNQAPMLAFGDIDDTSDNSRTKSMAVNWANKAKSNSKKKKTMAMF